ncbi:MAG: PssD/Cps14F family polysaccharide biosynthesis glycosyltransferase [Acidimicrobiales bacterium]
MLLVCSSGGHLTQLHQLEPWWRDHQRWWVTFDKDDARHLLADEQVIHAYHPVTRNLANLARNFVLTLSVLRRCRPDVIVSNGAGVAVPFFLLARFFGARTVYVEVYDRIDSRPLTSRMVAPLTDLFLVQWPEQRRMWPGSVLLGPLL